MKPKQVFASYDRRTVRTESRFRYCPCCGQPFEREQARPVCSTCGFVQFRNPAPAVSVLVIEGEKVLLGKRTGSIGRGRWALPSGYIEFDEDFLTAGIREVKEETGLDVEIKSILNVVSSFYAPGHHFLAVYLLAQVIGGELVASEEHEEVTWFSLSGTLPAMAFQEDVSVLELYMVTRAKGLDVDPRYAYRPAV